MKPLKQRREELAEKLCSPQERGRVISRLKSLMGISPEEPLPSGTPIISETIRLESELARKGEAEVSR